MPAPSELGIPVNVTATGNVGPPGRDVKLLGFYVNSTSIGIIVLRYGGASGTPMNGNMTPAVGFHRFPADCPGGLHLTVVSGTIDLTFFVA